MLAATHLNALVFLLQFAAERFELVLHGDRLVHFRPGLVFFLLEQVGPFARLGVVPLETLHFVEKLGIFLLDGFDFGEVVFAGVDELGEFLVGFADGAGWGG